MLTPTATPGSIVAKVQQDVTKTIHESRVHERFAAQGLEVHGTPPGQFANYLREEIARWGKVVKVAGVRAE